MRFILDPDATLDFTEDWSAWLAAGDTITAHTAVATTGVTIADSAHDDTTVTVWLTAGTLAATPTVTIHITTDQGREDDRSFSLTIRDR